MEAIEMEPIDRQRQNEETDDEYQQIDLQHQVQVHSTADQGQAATQEAEDEAQNRGDERMSLGRIQETEDEGIEESQQARPNVPRTEPQENTLGEYAALLNRPDAERGARNTFIQQLPHSDDEERRHRFCCFRCLPAHVVIGLFVAEAILSTIWMRFGPFLLYEVKDGIFSLTEGLLPVVTFVSSCKTFGPFWDFACNHYYATVRRRRTSSHATRMIGSWLTIATIALVLFLSLGGAFNNLVARSLCYGLLGGATASLVMAFFRMTSTIVDYPEYVRTRATRYHNETLVHFLGEIAKAVALMMSFLLVPLFRLGSSQMLVRMVWNVSVIFVVPVYALMRYDIRDMKKLCCASPDEDFEQQMNAMRRNEISQMITIPFYTKCKNELNKLMSSFKLPFFVPCVIINAIVGILSLVLLTSFPLMVHDKYYYKKSNETTGHPSIVSSIVSCTLIPLIYAIVAFIMHVVLSCTENMSWQESSLVLYLLGLSSLGFNMLFYYVFEILDVIIFWMVLFAIGYSLISYFEAKAFHLLFKDQTENHFKETWSHIKFTSGVLIYFIYVVIFILEVVEAVTLHTVLWYCMFILAGIGAVLLLYLIFHRFNCTPAAGHSTFCGCTPLEREGFCFEFFNICNVDR